MHRIAVEDYTAIIRGLLAPLQDRPAELVPIALAAGRVTASEVRSPIPLPTFRNSQMDGYAVRAADLRGIPVVLPVSGEVAAGAVDPAPLATASAIAIMTGAPLPTGADAVVPIEDTRLVDRGVEILRARRAGDYVREAGSDAAVGDVLLPAGLRLASRHLAALAAANLMDVSVHSRVRVAVISTGNELVPPGTTPLTHGRLPDANGIALATAATALGAEVVDLQLAGDDATRLGAVIDRAISSGAELVVTSGGISMGAHEPVRQLLEPLGATVGTVDMQPGGPQAYGHFSGVPIVCFPGNPVSSQLSFALFIAPILRQIAGMPAIERTQHLLAVPLDSIAGRRQFLRARLTADGVATVSGPGSHLVAALAAADVLIDVPAEVTALPIGASVDTVEL